VSSDSLCDEGPRQEEDGVPHDGSDEVPLHRLTRWLDCEGVGRGFDWSPPSPL